MYKSLSCLYKESLYKDCPQSSYFLGVQDHHCMVDYYFVVYFTTVILRLKMYQALCLYPNSPRHLFNSVWILEFSDPPKKIATIDSIHFISANIYIQCLVYARCNNDYKKQWHSPSTQWSWHHMSLMTVHKNPSHFESTSAL